ncbi:ATP-binding cassette domain-containing protein [Eubacterium sp. 1001713B170207_170306_E7]|uniref:amino acid ABC transporter ATP-binding protein n=1 Tax=Eubacterium sp. 1001713B170207_170306_E7 TaxID=2787097 RepID=UPI001FABF520|nr:ATP-binding cassette domain-containing protein [Eubacterium sp. 1001713B170207_170306_E7]
MNLLIEDKKAVGIMGASGSGKSTLLRQLAGIEFPEEGSIMINETAVTRKKARAYQREIGVVFQRHNLFPHLSLKKNLLLILEKIKRMDPEEAGQKADVLLDQFHLAEQADKLPRHVSGGQAQRASIARALCTEPELLFLDEPTAALDPILTGEVLEAVTALKHLGKDCVFVTHEIDFLKQFADYFVFMDQGEILEHGQTDLLESPKTDKLAAFLRKEG